VSHDDSEAHLGGAGVADSTTVVHGARRRQLSLGGGMAPAQSLVGRGWLWWQSVGGAGRMQSTVGFA
jgi:hypothetical protein